MARKQEEEQPSGFVGGNLNQNFSINMSDSESEDSGTESSDMRSTSNKDSRTCSMFAPIASFFKVCFGTFDSDMRSSTTRNRKTSRHKRKRHPRSNVNMVRLKVGWEGKEIKLPARDLNISRTFGVFSILLDSHNRMVPLDRDGCPIEPLDPEQRYMVAANIVGSSKKKWDELKKENKLMKKAGKEEKKQKKSIKEKDTPTAKEAASASELPTASLLQVSDGADTTFVLEDPEAVDCLPDAQTYSSYSVYPSFPTLSSVEISHVRAAIEDRTPISLSA